jgi:hypothetical protein
LGVALGAAVDHLALGLALGTAFGAAVDVVSHALQMNIKKPRPFPASNEKKSRDDSFHGKLGR